jgi:hypothetical protein
VLSDAIEPLLAKKIIRKWNSGNADQQIVVSLPYGVISFRRANAGRRLSKPAPTLSPSPRRDPRNPRLFQGHRVPSVVARNLIENSSDPGADFRLMA